MEKEQQRLSPITLHYKSLKLALAGKIEKIFEQKIMNNSIFQAEAKALGILPHTFLFTLGHFEMGAGEEGLASFSEVSLDAPVFQGGSPSWERKVEVPLSYLLKQIADGAEGFITDNNLRRNDPTRFQPEIESLRLLAKNTQEIRVALPLREEGPNTYGLDGPVEIYEHRKT